ncbi:MAG: hypothetical protein ABI332_06220 [Polyangiaceae bacterium]
MDRVHGSRRNKRALVVAALVVATAACVKVPDNVKATFAPPAPNETDNYALNARHDHAPKDDPVAKPLLAGLDASIPPDASAPLAEEMCPRDTTLESSADASARLSSNCLPDAGSP